MENVNSKIVKFSAYFLSITAVYFLIILAAGHYHFAKNSGWGLFVFIIDMFFLALQIKFIIFPALNGKKSSKLVAKFAFTTLARLILTVFGIYLAICVLHVDILGFALGLAAFLGILALSLVMVAKDGALQKV